MCHGVSSILHYFPFLLKQDERLITEADNILHMHIAASAYYITQQQLLAHVIKLVICLPYY